MKVRKGSSTEFILITLERSVDGLMGFSDFMNRPHWYGKGYGFGSPLKKSALSVAVNRMKERGLVEFEKNAEDQILIKLTDMGKDFLGDLSSSGDEWDGKWRIVIFDIPETKKAIRDLFRRRLKDWGFKAWQKSVWISSLAATQKLRQLITKLGIDDWVIVIESSDPAIETLLKRSLKQ